MWAKSFLYASFFAAAGMNFVSAQVTDVPPIPPPAATAVAPHKINPNGEMVSECGPEVKMCKPYSKPKVVQVYAKTHTRAIVSWHEKVINLPAVTETRTHVVFTTKAIDTIGHCVNTTTHTIPDTTTIIIHVNSTSTKEFVPFTTVIKNVTSTIHETLTKQCVVRQTGHPAFPRPLSTGTVAFEQPLGDIVGDGAIPEATTTSNTAPTSTSSSTTPAEDEAAPSATDGADAETAAEEAAESWGW